MIFTPWAAAVSTYLLPVLGAPILQTLLRAKKSHYTALECFVLACTPKSYETIAPTIPHSASDTIATAHMTKLALLEPALEVSGIDISFCPLPNDQLAWHALSQESTEEQLRFSEQESTHPCTIQYGPRMCWGAAHNRLCIYFIMAMNMASMDDVGIFCLSELPNRGLFLPQRVKKLV